MFALNIKGLKGDGRYVCLYFGVDEVFYVFIRFSLAYCLFLHHSNLKSI